MTAVDDFRTAQRRLLEHHGVEAESHFFQVPVVEGEVHALVAGEGPAVVMVPGFGDPSAIWAPLMAELPGFRLHVVDRPRFGLTGDAPYRTSTFRSLAVDFLEQVLDELGLDRPLFVGNSIGSLWILWLALDRPDRVRRMVHIGCPAFILGTSAPLPMRLMSVPSIGRLLMKLASPSPDQVKRFAKMVGEDLTDHVELQHLLVAAQNLPGAPEAILELLDAVVTLRGPRPELVLDADHLSRVRQPVLLIWGAHDPFGSVAVGQEAASHLPDARFRIVSDGGHVPWVSCPSEVAGYMVPFLERGGGVQE